MDSALIGILNDFVSEVSMEVVFELHRAIKVGYYRELIDPDPKDIIRRELVSTPGLDVFGQSQQDLKDSKMSTICPRCDAPIGIYKFAPHLEKCLGLGRNSSRQASKKNAVVFDSDSSSGNDNDYVPEKNPSKKMKKDGFKEKDKEVKDKERDRPSHLTSSPRRSTKQSSTTLSESTTSDQEKLKPSSLQHTMASFVSLSTDMQHTLLGQICGVVSERTKRLCTRSINCPQHSEEQRREIRTRLMPSSSSSASSASAFVKSSSSHHTGKRRSSMNSIDDDDDSDSIEEQRPAKRPSWDAKAASSTSHHSSSREDRTRSKKSKKGSEKKKKSKGAKTDHESKSHASHSRAAKSPPSSPPSPPPSSHHKSSTSSSSSSKTKKESKAPSMPDMPIFM